MESSNRDHTLAELAKALGTTSAALAKRIHRDTLKAHKENGKWLVSHDEFERIAGTRDEVALSTGTPEGPQKSSEVLAQIKQIRDDLRREELQIAQVEEQLQSLKKSHELRRQLLKTTEQLQKALANR